MTMLTLLPRRFIRRPIAIISVLGCSVLLAGYFNDFARFVGHHHPAPSPKAALHDYLTTTSNEPETVTLTRTAWVRTTQTVTAGFSPGETPPAGIYDLDDKVHDRQFASNAEEGDKPQLEKHVYHPDGLLEVNPRGPHPIFGLIKRAEEEWEAKEAKASKTLGEAVREYERRYKRPPPLGFDDWWNYAEENNVQLPDDYDQIYWDLEPYWGVDPKDLQDIESEWEGHADSYTLGKEADGPIKLVNYTLPENEDVRFALSKGAFEIMDLLEDVQDFIPPFRAVVSPHDNPNLPTDFELKEEMLQHAAAGTFIDINNPPEVKLNGWISACDPMSPAWQDPIDWDGKAPSQLKKMFIYKHREAMDPCNHPSLLLLHGQFLSHRAGPVPHRKMVPQFSYCATMLHHDIKAAMPINWIDDILPRADDPEWDDKAEDRLQWRGSNTGIWHDLPTRWRDAQRARLVAWATKDMGSNVTVLMPTRDEHQMIGEDGIRSVKKAKYAPALLDIAFAGEPLSCAPQTCELLSGYFEYRQSHNIKRQGEYKYILDVDGNGWSSRFKRLITSNALIFKSTIYPEWFTDRIAPWVHYVPVQVDLSDLYDSLMFFHGDPSGNNAHEDLARKIAKAGREWSRKFWRKEDLTAYMFRLFLEYARVMNPERKSMNYIHVED